MKRHWRNWKRNQRLPDAPSRGINYFPLFPGVSWQNTNPTPLTGQNNKCAYGKIYPARVPGGIYFDFI